MSMLVRLFLTEVFRLNEWRAVNVKMLAGLHWLDVTLLEVTNQHETASGAEMSTRTNSVPSTTEVKNIIRSGQTLEIAGDQSQRIAPDELASLVGVTIIANSMNSTTNGTRIMCAKTG